MTAALSGLYERRRLGDVCTLQRGFDLPTKDRTPGPFPLVTSSGPTDTHDEAKVSGPGVVTGRSGSIGNIFFVEEDFWPLNTALYVKNFHGNDERYIYYLLQSFDLARFTSGAGVPTLNRNHVHSEPVLVAKSVEEQKRIVAVLDQAFAALDRARAHAEANLADANNIFDGWLTAVFHDHPSSWRTEKLRNLCHQITVGHVGSMAERYVESGIPFLRSQNIRAFEIALGDVKFIDDGFHRELTKSILGPGDVAIVRTGYPGTAAVIPQSLPVANCSDLVIARPKNVISPEFLVMFLNSSFGKSMVAEKAVGAAQKHFNVGAAKEVDFSFPPIAEQERLVAQAKWMRSRMGQLESIYEMKLADIANIRQSLLQKAFSGELA